MKPRLRVVALAAVVLGVSACVSPPAPKYQPSIENTEALARQPGKLAIGTFTAAAGVENHALAVRASQLQGGSDGTFSTYLRDALIAELETAARYDEHSQIVLSGQLTRNELSSGVETGTATVSAAFVLTCDTKVCFKKELVAHHQWQSSIIGAIAIAYVGMIYRRAA